MTARHRLLGVLLGLSVSVGPAGCSSARSGSPAARSGASASSASALSSAPAAPGSSVAPSSVPPSSHAAVPRPSPTTARIPPLSATQRAEGLVDIRTVVPDALVDLRYATTNNFTKVQLYPKDARCLVHRTMVDGLRVAAARLRAAGYLIVFWDCYRPHSVQVRMFEVVPNPAWVARPGQYARSHESARSVDITLASRAPGSSCPAGRVLGHCLVDMGTGFDDFTPRAYAYATDGVSAAERDERARLRTAFAAGGLAVYDGEWWHFDGPGSLTGRPLLRSSVD